MVQLQPVIGSSNIAAQGYDAASQTLAVIFRKGKFRYDYKAVPPRVAQEFASAESPGSYLRANIAGAFEFDKLDLQQEEATLQDTANG